jgi:hypothetical protein
MPRFPLPNEPVIDLKPDDAVALLVTNLVHPPAKFAEVRGEGGVEPAERKPSEDRASAADLIGHPPTHERAVAGFRDVHRGPHRTKIDEAQGYAGGAEERIQLRERKVEVVLNVAEGAAESPADRLEGVADREAGQVVERPAFEQPRDDVQERDGLFAFLYLVAEHVVDLVCEGAIVAYLREQLLPVLDLAGKVEGQKPIRAERWRA